MDVLQLMKQDHSEVNGKLELLISAKSLPTVKKVFADLVNQLSHHLYMEEQYLNPEISSALRDGGEAAKKNRQMVVKYLKKLEKHVAAAEIDGDAFSAAYDGLKHSIAAHLASEDEVLMPKLRQLIPTIDREELGQLYLDLRSEQEYPLIIGKKPSKHSRLQ